MNESEDAELIAVAALVRHQAAVIEGQVRQFGELQFDPWTPEVRALEAMLKLRGVLSQDDLRPK